jgi:quercetin dioxygenase-like cupin family protein
MSGQNGYVFRQGEGISIVLRGTTMHVKVTEEQSQGAFSLIEMVHPPNLNIPLHAHPRGHEAFYVLDGSYRIQCGEGQYESQRGDFVFVPPRSNP